MGVCGRCVAFSAWLAAGGRRRRSVQQPADGLARPPLLNALCMPPCSQSQRPRQAGAQGGGVTQAAGGAAPCRPRPHAAPRGQLLLGAGGHPRRQPDVRMPGGRAHHAAARLLLPAAALAHRLTCPTRPDALPPTHPVCQRLHAAPAGEAPVRVCPRLLGLRAGQPAALLRHARAGAGPRGGDGRLRASADHRAAAAI